MMQELMFLISRAELIGSRGRARKYGHPEPPDSDYDWAIFTDDAMLVRQCLAVSAKIINNQSNTWTLIFRKCGFTLHSSAVDINVVPAARRAVTHEVWRMIETGWDKDKAWAYVNAEAGLPTN